MHWLAAFVLTLLASGTVIEALQIRPCLDDLPYPTFVEIRECTQAPCQLVRGTKVPIVIVFKALFDAESPRYIQVVHAGATATPTELTPDRENVCNWLTGSSCPIREGEIIITGHTLDVLPEYPLAQVTIHLSVLDEQSRTHTCFVFDAQLVDK
uniref:ML domain-containing protein n=1 Tax=Anopheles dirus TaxID=7168 RepID=A0A182NHY9_9DIPT